MIMPLLESSGSLDETDRSSSGRGASTSQPSAPQPGRFLAKRYAVKFEPPTLLLEYEEDVTAKRRVRAVKLNSLHASVDTDRLTRKIIRSFPRKLDVATVKYDQVRKLVIQLVQHSCGAEAAATKRPPRVARLEVDTASGTHSNGPPLETTVSPRLHEDGAPRGSRSSQPSSASRHLTPLASIRRGGLASQQGSGCVGASTDSRFSTSTTSLHSEPSLEHDLDSAMQDLDLDAESSHPARPSSQHLHTSHHGATGNDALAHQVHGTASPGLLSRDGSLHITDALLSPGRPVQLQGMAEGTPLGGLGHEARAKSRFAQEADSQVLELEFSGDVDLNKVSELELALAKKAMESDFKRNQLKPGDPGYQYDKQMDFGPPTEDNDWDDS